jgi:hypothetical protein
MDRQMIMCVVTRYWVDYGPNPHPLEGHLHKTTSEEETSFHVHGDWLYLHNSAASARVEDLLTLAREGHSWCAQMGTPPVYIDGEGWGGRNWPEIKVSSDALLETLGRVLATDRLEER